MKTIQAAEFKNNFSYFLEKAMMGEEFIVSYGRKKKKVARFGPYKEKQKIKRKLGILEGKVSIKIHKDWEMTNDEFLGA